MGLSLLLSPPLPGEKEHLNRKSCFRVRRAMGIIREMEHIRDRAHSDGGESPTAGVTMSFPPWEKDQKDAQGETEPQAVSPYETTSRGQRGGAAPFWKTPGET